MNKLWRHVKLIFFFYATIKIPLRLEALIPRIGRCWKTLWHRYWQKPMVSTCFNMSPLVNFPLKLNPLIQAILDRPSEAPSAELLVMQTRRVGFSVAAGSPDSTAAASKHFNLVGFPSRVLGAARNATDRI